MPFQVTTGQQPSGQRCLTTRDHCLDQGAIWHYQPQKGEGMVNKDKIGSSQSITKAVTGGFLPVMPYFCDNLAYRKLKLSRVAPAYSYSGMSWGNVNTFKKQLSNMWRRQSPLLLYITLWQSLFMLLNWSLRQYKNSFPTSSWGGAALYTNMYWTLSHSTPLPNDLKVLRVVQLYHIFT